MRVSLYFFITTMLAFATFAQSPSEQAPTPQEKLEMLERASAGLVRATYSEVGNLRTLENRISFTAELASLLWYTDRKEAAAMFGSTVSDFKQLLSHYNSQMNNLVGNDEDIYPMSRPSGPYRTVEPSQLTVVQRKIRNVTAVRQQIALNIAEHEPDLAYNFFYDTLNSITNPAMHKMVSQMDTYFENQLLQQIARTNASKAAELAKKRLEKDGLDHQSIAILKKIYENDADKGREFAAAMLRRMIDKSGEGKAESMQWNYYFSTLLSFAVETKESSAAKNRKPVLDDAEMRDLAELIARHYLDSEHAMMGDEEIDTIEKVLPARAVQIRAKRKREEAKEKEEKAALDAETREMFERAEANRIKSRELQDRMAEEQKAQTSLENELTEGASKLGQKDLPAEERNKILARAREILAKTPGRERQILGLSMLAAQVNKAGDERLAAEIMGEADALVTTDPRNYQDFLFTWMVVSGYAETDPNRAFSLLEETIIRANEVISSAVRIAEFIDVEGEMMENGEILLGAFGGQLVRGITSDTRIAESTLRSLAEEDFEKLTSIANRVERPEARIMAKLLILRSVTGKRPEIAAAESVSEQK